MAVVKKVNKYKASKKTVNSENVSSRKGRRSISLATTKFKPSQTLWHYPFMLYGEKKIGKTTLLSMFPNAYAFMFEPNDSYELYKNDILSWPDFADLVPQFLDGEHKFESCWIDNGRNCYDMALNLVCKENGISHPSEVKDFGQTWAKIYNEFSTPIRQLMQSKYGFAVTCHETEKEIETRSGRTFLQMVPDLTSSATRLFCGEIYNIFYYHFEGSKRFLQIQGDDYIMAGHRMKGHFLTPKGERIYRIPMGDSEEEAFENLIRAFDNKQDKTYQPEEAKKRKESEGNKKDFKKKKLKK